jgi:hypothetical protein
MRTTVRLGTRVDEHLPGEVLERGAEQHGSEHQEGDPVEQRSRVLGEGGDLDGFAAQQDAVGERGAGERDQL